jgi:hypothetical protein
VTTERYRRGELIGLMREEDMATLLGLSKEACVDWKGLVDWIGELGIEAELCTRRKGEAVCPSCVTWLSQQSPYRLGKYLANFRYPGRTNLVTKQSGASDLLKGCTTQRDNKISLVQAV